MTDIPNNHLNNYPAWWQIVQAELDRRGWLPHDLGRAANNMDPSLYSKYKRGVRPGRASVARIAAALGIPRERLEEALGWATGVNPTLATEISIILAPLSPENQRKLLKRLARLTPDQVQFGRALEALDRLLEAED